MVVPIGHLCLSASNIFVDVSVLVKTTASIIFTG